jgi:hypothetical protein
MLVQGDRFIEVVVWQKRLEGSVLRRWQNSFQFISQDVFTRGTMQNLCNTLYYFYHWTCPADVVIMGALAWQWSPSGLISDEDTAYIWPYSRTGNRGMNDFTPRLAHKFAVTWNKEVQYGRSGRLAFRASLNEGECEAIGDDAWAIKSQAPYDPLHTFWARYYLNNTPLPHAVLTRLNELSYPTDARQVSEIKIGHLTKLQSIEDAQLRKTFRAQPFEQSWYQGIESIFQMIVGLQAKIEEQPVGLLHADAEIMTLIASAMSGYLGALEKYWEDGLEPTVIYNWRPTAGLDPNVWEGQRMWGIAVEQIEQVGEIIQDIIAYPEDPIPELFVEPFFVKMAYVFLLYDRIGVMRFTGTPIRPGTVSVVVPA